MRTTRSITPPPSLSYLLPLFPLLLISCWRRHITVTYFWSDGFDLLSHASQHLSEQRREMTFTVLISLLEIQFLTMPTNTLSSVCVCAQRRLQCRLCTQVMPATWRRSATVRGSTPLKRERRWSWSVMWRDTHDHRWTSVQWAHKKP